MLATDHVLCHSPHTTKMVYSPFSPGEYNYHMTRDACVFVVDDDLSVRNRFARLRRAAGHDVHGFASAREFLDAVGSGVSGCLVLDSRMPGVTGEELQTELNEARLTIAGLQSNVDDYQDRLGLLQQDFDGTVMSVEQQESELNNTRGELRRREAIVDELRDTLQDRITSLERIRTERDSLQQSLDIERERRLTAETTVGENASQRESEVNELRTELRRFETTMTELRDTLQDRAETLERVKFEKESLQDALNDERERRASLESSIDDNAQQSRLLFAEKETALSTLGRHERSIADMQSMVDEHRDAITEANEENKLVLADLMDERDARTRLEATLREARMNIEGLQDGTHESLKEKDALIVTIREQSENLASLGLSHEETVASVCRAEKTISELTTRIGTLETSEAGLKDERQDLFTRLQQERDQSRLLESTLECNQDVLHRIQEDSESLKSLQIEYTGIQSSLVESMGRMKHLVTERDDALEMADRSRNTIRELRTVLDDLRVKASERDTALANAEAAEQTVAELRATLAELGDVMAERDNAMTIAAQANDAINELQTLVTDLQTRTGDMEEANGRLVELESAVANLDKVIAERDTALSVLDEANTTIDELRVELEELRNRLESLEKQNSDLLADLESEPEIIKFEVTEVADGETRYDAEYGLLYNDAPDPVDDLKAISGIAFVYEERLNSLGVYRYEQILNWNENNITNFGELLESAYNDRIRRDDWVNQARRLHNEKYGDDTRQAA
jgi:predicted flap endonuclease-1-like 5' DNA nuclease/CheY-like chemotaxis protein